MAKAVPISIGDRFGKLVILGIVKEPNCRGHLIANCFVQCDCGALKMVWKHNLTTGHATSCGCAKVEFGKTKRTHGHSRADLGKQSRTYKSWSSMKDRCGKMKGYEHVSVCERWMSFENFLADMGERPDDMSLDRIDPFGNYEPRNCRWVTRKEQSQNRRPWKHTPEGIARITLNLPTMQ